MQSDKSGFISYDEIQSHTCTTCKDTIIFTFGEPENKICECGKNIHHKRCLECSKKTGLCLECDKRLDIYYFKYFDGLK